MKTNTIIVTIIAIAIIVGGGTYLGVWSPGAATTTNGSEKTAAKTGTESVGTDGKQIVEITARGGYTPKVSIAKAGVPTIIRIVTNNTFDCASSISIPSIGYRNNLPRTGTTDIEVPAQSAGTKLQGSCSMGMYSFTVSFE
jgi:plastocyanin domain-containing protein